MPQQEYAFIETLGCQMNERDSEIMAQLLSGVYQQTADINEADVVVVNTCSIREKAEQKAFSLLGRLRQIKKENPAVVIAVTGCVAQQEGERLLARMPHVDIIVGPQHIYELPELIAKVKKEGRGKIATSMKKDFVIPAFLPSVANQATVKRFVTVMQGCNNFCTYCVVPFTRGREISRASHEIIEEIEHLGQHGVKEVTLLGQNVNSYGLDRKNGKDGDGFPELLRQVAAIETIKRIRFTTSHPKDLSPELMAAFRDIDKLCPHIHLPVQSGSNQILSMMNRHYTVESYLDKIAQLRSSRPDIAITTDIIVGFPGETEKDFEATLSLLEAVRFHGAFSFKYSDRPQARAAQFQGKVEETVKTVRLAQLQKRQDEISLDRNKEYIDEIVDVMNEGKSKGGNQQYTGRTPTNHIVNYLQDKPLGPGDFLKVRIQEACLHSLKGIVESTE